MNTEEQSQENCQPEIKLRGKYRGYTDHVEIIEEEFEGETQPCVVFSAEGGYTGVVVPLVDILKYALVHHRPTLELAMRELGLALGESSHSADEGEHE